MTSTPTPDAIAHNNCRQPLSFLNIKVAFVAEMSFQDFDRILETTFHIKIEPCKFFQEKVLDEQERQAAEVLWRGMLLARTFLQVAGLPFFEAGCITDVQRAGDDGQWLIRCGIPHIANIDSECYPIAYGKGVEIAVSILKKDARTRDMRKLLDWVYTHVIGKLRNKVVVGKSTLSVLREAYRTDVPFIHLGGGVYQLGWGSQRRIIDRSSSDSDTSIGVRLTQHKMWASRIADMAGLPAPLHYVASNEEQSMQAAEKIGWPVVVKPVDGDRGEGVTVNVTSRERLVRAFAQAQGVSRSGGVIVERQVPGVCHRLFIAGGCLLYAVKRLPKSVVGDGVHTVAELIELANASERRLPPWLRSEVFPSDAEALVSIQAAGFTLDSVPARNVLVPLRAIESTAEGGFDVDVTHRVHPHNIDIAVRAAALFKLEMAGVDIIATDIERAWHETGAIINEINYAPALGLAEISRGYVPEYLRRLMSDSTVRIPVEVFAGSDSAFRSARKRQEQLTGGGLRCYLSNGDVMLNETGDIVPLLIKGLADHCQALLLDSRVDAIVLVVQSDDVVESVFPIDKVTAFFMDDDAETSPSFNGRFNQVRQFFSGLEDGVAKSQ